jgi:hypothetical protein
VGTRRRSRRGTATATATASTGRGQALRAAESMDGSIWGKRREVEDKNEEEKSLSALFADQPA